MRIEMAALETPIGKVALAWDGDTLVAVEIAWVKDRSAWDTKDVPGDTEARLARRLRGRFPEAEVTKGDGHAAPVRALERYFAAQGRYRGTNEDLAAVRAAIAEQWAELRRRAGGGTP